MSSERANEPLNTQESTDSVNIVAWAGVVFGVIAAVLYGVLFYLLSKLPSSRNELQELSTNAPALTQLLITGGSAGLLNIVSLILCGTGCLIPGKSRFEAVAGSIVAFLMLLAVFSVIIAGLLLAT